MKRFIYIFFYFLFLFQQIHNLEITNTSYIIKNIKTPTNYSLEYEYISPLFSLTQIPVVILQQRYPLRKIATFQLPPTLKPNEYPQFSLNGNLLLILNAPWSLFYEENPTTYEWNLFNIKEERTITIFPRNSNPRFINNNTISYNNNFNTYTIPTETQGFFSQFTNFFKNLFLPQPEKPQPSFIQRPPIITEKSLIETAPIQQEEKIIPAFQPQPYIQPIIIEPSIPKPITTPSIPEPQKITPSEYTFITPTAPEQSIIPFKQKKEEKELYEPSPNILLKTFNLLTKIAHQPIAQQNAWLEKYVPPIIEKYTPSYNNEIKLLLPAQTTSVTISYEKARELLKQIDELSFFMQDAVNSPEIIRDLGQKVGMLCSIALELTSEEQKLILHEILILIQKYEQLYNSIIKQLQQQNVSTSTLTFQAYNLIKQIESNSIALQNNTIPSLEGIKNVEQLSKKLDILYKQLSPDIQQDIIDLQKNIVNKYIPTYKIALENNIKINWQHYGTNCIKIAGLLCTAGITSALITILSQHFQMILGITTSLDTNLLINNASMVILGNVIKQLLEGKYSESSSAIIAGAGGTVISEMAITPYLQQTIETYTIQAPSFIGPVQGALSWEAFEIISSIINQHGGINAVIKTINFKNLLLRPIQPSYNELTTFLLPKIQNLVKNEQIAFVMTDIGWKVFISALIGSGMYMAGIGQAENLTMLEALYYASLEGIKKGFIASVLSSITKQTGALITIPSALALPSATMVNSLLQGTEIVVDPVKIVPDILATTAQVAADFVIDAKGFTNMLQTTVSNVKETLKSRWTEFYSLYDVYSIVKHGFPEVNPPQEEAAAL